MYTICIKASSSDSDSLKDQLEVLAQRPPAWVMLYGPDDAPFEDIMANIRRRFPEAQTFGATSFRGVFSAQGFSRDTVLLIAERQDEIKASVSLQHGDASQAKTLAIKACREIGQRLEGNPSTLLLHATPGFEERILEGVLTAFGTDVQVYGGSAADDTLSGRWRVFANGRVCSQGFLLIGVSSRRAPLGSFVGGFLPTEHSGVVTKVRGRIVLEIDSKPAAAVYNDWTRGAIAPELVTGGNVLHKTSLLPLARSLGESHVVPRRLLSHPHEVMADSQSIAFFSEFSFGDRITLMTSTRDPLVSRVRRAVQRARGSTATRPRGALLVYCGGSLGGLMDQANTIASEFASELGDAPFVGIATFGEQGPFFNKAESWHGNLMCSAVLF
jgi:hypothetical protein